MYSLNHTHKLTNNSFLIQVFAQIVSIILNFNLVLRHVSCFPFDRCKIRAEIWFRIFMDICHIVH